MPRARKYPVELLDRATRLVFDSGRPIAHCAEHRLAGWRCDIRAPVEHPGDRGDRYACGACDIPDRGPGPGAVLGVGGDRYI